MKFQNNILYIEFADFLQAGWSSDAILKANLRNGAAWQMIPDPADKRKVLVQFDTLIEKHKEKLSAHFGNPYEFVARQPIKKMVVPDAKAEQFYRAYRYDGIKELPTDHQLKYTKAASWLNMMVEVMNNKTLVKKVLNLSLDQFWTGVISIIQAEKIDLPANYGGLVSKPNSAIKKYKETGYESLIDWRFGNKIAAKVGKADDGYSIDREQQQLAIIRKLARQPMNLNNTQIAAFANEIFIKNGWTTISASTVGNILEKHMPNIIAARKGSKVFANTTAMQVVRKAPEYPTYYWTLDGWTVELLYQDGQRYDNRLVMVVVLDACNKYPVGYAIGDRENTELIRLALRNAVIHMQELHGAVYRPWQLQSDNYGIKNLTPFYTAVSHLHTPAAVGNAKAKIIEPYFKMLNDTYCRTQFNWSGHNITASQKNQPNIERLNQIKKSMPTREEVVDQINRFMFKERASKIEDYRNRWEAMPVEDQVTLNPEECITVFGRAHNEWNTLTGRGLICTLNGHQLIYDSFDPEFRNHQFITRFKITYDPYDLNQVIATTEDGSKRFLLHQKRAIAMDIKSASSGDQEYLQEIRNFNKIRHAEIVQTELLDDTLCHEIIAGTPLQLANEDEAALKLMFTSATGQQKDGIQDAKGLRKVQAANQRKQLKASSDEKNDWMARQNNHLEQSTDFSKYL